MKEGECEITMITYPGQRVQTGVMSALSGAAFGDGSVTKKAGTGSVVSSNGRYLTPEGLVTVRTVKVTIKAPDEEEELPDNPPTNDAPYLPACIIFTALSVCFTAAAVCKRKKASDR